jgi:hypothetical protein
MGKTSKDRNYSFEHTKLRILQRYNLEITLDTYNYLCHMIKNNINITLVDKEEQKNDVQSIYDLDLGIDGKIRVVWSNERNYITTALPRR